MVMFSYDEHGVGICGLNTRIGRFFEFVFLAPNVLCSLLFLK